MIITLLTSYYKFHFLRLKCAHPTLEKKPKTFQTLGYGILFYCISSTCAGNCEESVPYSGLPEFDNCPRYQGMATLESIA